jgi:hypothetical protein
VLVHRQHAYELAVDARVLDWPDWADRLVVRFLSRWQGSAADVSEVVLARPGQDGTGVWRAQAEGGVTVHATPDDPAKPLLFTVEAELVGPEQTQPIEVLGYAELALSAYDPAFRGDRHADLRGVA